MFNVGQDGFARVNEQASFVTEYTYVRGEYLATSIGYIWIEYFYHHG